MKNPLFLILLFAASCVLPETRTTVITQHIFSQEDTSFYFSDCEKKSRADSDWLINLTGDLKFYNAADLSKDHQEEIRLLYNWGMGVTYLISLTQNGRLTITVEDTTNQNQPWSDTIAVLDTVQLLTTTCWLNRSVYKEVTLQIFEAHLEQQEMNSSTGSTDASIFILETRLSDKHTIRGRYGLDLSSVNEDDRAFANICLTLLNSTDILRNENKMFEERRMKRAKKTKKSNSLLQ